MGTAVANAAKEAGVTHFIWAGLPNAKQLSKGKHVSIQLQSLPLRSSSSLSLYSWQAGKTHESQDIVFAGKHVSDARTQEF